MKRFRLALLTITIANIKECHKEFMNSNPWRKDIESLFESTLSSTELCFTFLACKSWVYKRITLDYKSQILLWISFYQMKNMRWYSSCKFGILRLHRCLLSKHFAYAVLHASADAKYCIREAELWHEKSELRKIQF